jgi:hypothetical protein
VTGSRQRLIWVAALLLMGLTGAQAARAQALPTATGPGAYVIVGGTYSDFQADYGQRKISGASVYVDSNLQWRWGVETEARRMMYPNFGESQSTLLAGPRWSFHPKGLVPYVKFLVGGGRFEFPYGFGYGDYFVMAPGAGVDLRVGRKIRVRLIDVEYQDWPGFTYGTIHPYGISAGISFQVLGSERTKMSE